MPETQTLVTFAAACVLFAVIPGPAVIYIVTRAVDQGRMAGIASVLGIASGTLVHVPAAALGLSALMLSSATAFTVVKYLGAAYLVYLGIRKIMGRNEAFGGPEGSRQPLMRIFRQGAVVGVLNPKTALFFLAFLPQFVDPALGLRHAAVHRARRAARADLDGERQLLRPGHRDRRGVVAHAEPDVRQATGLGERRDLHHAR